MIRDIIYRGPLIAESSVADEQSSDGMTPNYAQGMQVGRDRWLILYDTIDRQGRDCWRAIFYQLRAGGPAGKVIVERRLWGMEPLATLGDGTEILRSNGQPAVFGVPKGAVIAGCTPDHANVFAITWYGVAVARKDNLLDRVNRHPALDDALIEPYHEIMHVRLNDAEDDIEVAAPRRRLLPDGAAISRAHGWTQPIADNPSCTRWLDAFTGQTGEGDRVMGHSAGAIAHEWDSDRREYVCARVGPFVEVKPDLRVSEACLVKLAERDYVMAVRSFNQGGHTYWFRAADPMAGWGQWSETSDTVGQRYAFRCGDGELRFFANNQRVTPYGDRRNPLYCWDVAPDGFGYSNRRVVLDARQEDLPLPNPFVDHVHLYEPQGGRQVMSVRTITMSQVWRNDQEPPLTDEAMAAAGIHHVEIIYDRECPSRWRFD